MQSTIQTTWSDGAANISGQWSETGDGDENRDIALPASGTPVHVLMNITIAQLKVWFLKTTVDILVETNAAGGSHQESWTVKAGETDVWRTGMAAKFAGNVTGLYITNQSSPLAVGTVNIRPLIDSTP